jgi:4-amino-4-deoxy-L-arabinose transferase-like glycosyltransferase
MERDAAILFWLFVGCHALVWIVVPTLAVPTVHREVIETINWGKYFRWSYWQHPPLQTWFIEVFLRVFGRGSVGVYLASQVSLSVCFWAVWRFARDVLSPGHALLSVLVLEGILYYNYNTPKFNHDGLQLPLWALTVLTVWRALTRGGWWRWGLAGFVAGLGVLSKYTILVLLGPLGLLVLVHPHVRRHLATPGPYLALVAFVLTVTPHVRELIDIDFSTIAFFLARAERRGWFAHLDHPLRFAVSLAFVLAPVGLLVAALGPGSRGERDEPAPNGFTRAFLFTVALAPVLLVLLFSVITGRKLYAGWSTPFWSFTGVWLLYHRRPALTERVIRRFGYAVLGLAIFWAVVFAGQFLLGPALTGKRNPELFPARAIAGHVTQEWRRRYGTPLPVAAGHKWFVENVGYYSPDRPDVYDLDDPDPAKYLGTSDVDFNRRGGVIVWDASVEGDRMPGAWRARFPDSQPQPAIAFPWLTWARVPPVRLGWAVLAGAPRADGK